MKFHVVWINSAEDRLAHLWLGSRIASQITKSADHLDFLLAESPLEVGESRSGNRRIAFEPPLAINYFVDESMKKVVIVDVWLI